MKEIIPLCFGQCGINIGSDFIQNIYKEHGLNSNDENTIRGEPSIYFSESMMENDFKSRSLLVNLNHHEKMALNHHEDHLDLRNNIVSQEDLFFHPTWPGGRNLDEGDTFAENVLDRVRKLVEDCDSLCGFQFIQPLIRAPSGFCSRIMTSLREEYPDKINWATAIFPVKSEMTMNSVWMYDSVLSLQYLRELTDLVTCIHNDELEQRLMNQGKKEPTFSDMNGLIRNYLPNITSAFRYPEQGGCDLRKMAITLNPQLFQLVDIHEMNSFSTEQTLPDTVHDMANQMFKKFQSKNVYSALSIVRANRISTLQVERIMKNSAKDNLQSVFPLKSIVVSNPESDCVSSTLLINSSSILSSLKNIYERVDAHFKRKAFVYYYTGSQLDETEITEAQYYLKDTIEFLETNSGSRSEQDED